MKKLISIILSVCMILSVCALPAFAEDTIKVTVDGNFVDCAAYGQEPVAIDGTTLVPLRSVFEALGATVAWDGDTQTVVSARGTDTITLKLNSQDMFVNGEVKVLSVPAQSMNERTMVPVRAIAEAFGCDVKWDGDTRTVIVSTLIDSEETPEAVVSKLYEAQMNLDVDTAAKYFESEELANSYLGASSVEDLLGMSAADNYDERTTEILVNFVRSALNLGSYRIDEVTIDGDMAVVKTTVTMPDVNAVDMDSIPEDKYLEFIMKALDKCGLTLEDMQNQEIVADAMLEQEFTYALFELTFEYVLEVIAEDIQSGKAIVENETITLEKINGRWLITE